MKSLQKLRFKSGDIHRVRKYLALVRVRYAVTPTAIRCNPLFSTRLSTLTKPPHTAMITAATR